MSVPDNHKIKLGSLLIIALAGIASVLLMGPIPQDISYHVFADRRCLLSIPNCWNVISNIPFLIIGFLGMLFIIKTKLTIPLSINSFVFFLGIFFTGIGSAYYHFNPTNETLLWDRTPMTISFMAFFSMIIGEFISLKAGKRFLLPLIIIGLASIVYWQITYKNGHDDLRFYALVQFLPIVLIPIILLLFNGNADLKKYYWFILLAYLIAKLFEACDFFVFDSGHLISGHSIKHIVAAAGPLLFFIALNKGKYVAKAIRN